MDDAIIAALVGFSVVFIALILLTIIIYVFNKININAKNTVKSSVKSSEASVKTESLPAFNEGVEALDDETLISDDELVAVLTAAIMASVKRSSECNIKVKSIKRLPKTSPVWNTTGRNELIAGKL